MADCKSIFLILTALCCYFFCNHCYAETHTLQQGQHLTDWDELISPKKVFCLKFFSFGSSIKPYLGIFYNYNTLKRTSDAYDKFLKDKPVWVANRNNPITDIYGELLIDIHGKLSILSGGGTVVDIFSSPPITRNASAKLLDTGNFVLQELYPDGSVKRVLWQSFDYPTDTLLPGMKLGINLKTGHRWSLTSWRSETLPAEGSFTLTGDPNATSGQMEMVILRRGNVHWRSGSWKNGGFENTGLQFSPDVHLYYVSNETEQSFTYLTKTYDSSPSLTMYLNGQLKGSSVNLDVQCSSIKVAGCAESDVLEEMNCRKYCSFESYDHYYGQYIYGDEYEYDESHNLTFFDCERLCWRNCSCMAFTYATADGAGCKTFNSRRTVKYREETKDSLSKVIVCHPGYYGEYDEMKKRKKRNRILLITGIVSFALLLSCYLVCKKLHIRRETVRDAMLFGFLKAKKIQRLFLHQLRRLYKNIQTDMKINPELHYFTFQTISSATNNFSNTNKLGQGGFGAVYKGKLVDGQEIAVKRLSRGSEQGIKEFKNETELIAKLQHTNLVKLIGCCIEKKEQILVYEYMPNKSLDSFLFDPRKKGLLDWNTRFVIIDGIAHGLLYLHRFSRLRIIHRDLKASNILLDDYLKPKISDFGMAKLFGINESEANTSRVVGTRGYMPPEYMLEGSVSTKTDVFGFGVLLLEIVSSKMNHGTYDVEHPLNLLGLAWELWNEGRGLELMDPILEDSCTPKEVMTCIHVGLLCVQDHAMIRPTMSEVISMLTNENMHLPEPKRPAFFIERHDPDSARDDNLENGSVNGQSISILVAR